MVDGNEDPTRRPDEGATDHAGTPSAPAPVAFDPAPVSPVQPKKGIPLAGKIAICIVAVLVGVLIAVAVSRPAGDADTAQSDAERLTQASTAEAAGSLTFTVPDGWSVVESGNNVYYYAPDRTDVYFMVGTWQQDASTESARHDELQTLVHDFDVSITSASVSEDTERTVGSVPVRRQVVSGEFDSEKRTIVADFYSMSTSATVIGLIAPDEDAAAYRSTAESVLDSVALSAF